MGLTKVAIADVVVKTRLRGLDPAWVDLLAASIETDGLKTPIHIRESSGKPVLVAGNHRLEACRQLGWTKIDAILIAASALEAQLIEIDENLIRRDLSVLDRARFLAERKKFYLQLHPETAHGGAREAGGSLESLKAANFVHLPKRFTAEAAEKTGFSERAIRRSIEIATYLADDVVARIATTAIADNQAALELLCKQDGETQRRMVDLMLDPEAPIKTARAAVNAVEGRFTPKQDSDSSKFGRLVKAWEGATPKVRALFLDHLRELGDL